MRHVTGFLWIIMAIAMVADGKTGCESAPTPARSEQGVIVWKGPAADAFMQLRRADGTKLVFRTDRSTWAAHEVGDSIRIHIERDSLFRRD